MPILASDLVRPSLTRKNRRTGSGSRQARSPSLADAVFSEGEGIVPSESLDKDTGKRQGRHIF